MRVPIMVVLALGFLQAAESKQDIKKDLEAFQGTWLLVSGKQDGVDTPDEIVKKTKIIIAGNKFTFPADAEVGTSRNGTIEIDPSKSPNIGASLPSCAIAASSSEAKCPTSNMRTDF